MLKFDEKEMLKRGEKVYDLRGKIEDIADQLFKDGFKNIFISSSGGSLALMQPFENYYSTHSNIPIYLQISAELLVKGHSQLNSDSVVVLFSKSGTTEDTLKIAKYMREKGIRTIGIYGIPGAELENLVTYPICFYDGRPQEMVLYFLFMRWLFLNGEFPDYEEFVKELGNLPSALNSVRKQADEKGKEYAELYQNSPYQIWVGSGDLWGTTYSYSMCVLEESQWLRTKSVHSAEFFHGTIELIDDSTCLTLLKTEGNTRELDERVENFGEKYAKQFNVFDTADYDLPGISDKFRPLLAPPVMWAVLGRISVHLENIRNHSLETRRFYRKVEY